MVAYRRVGAIRADCTGNLRKAIAERPRVSSRPWARLGVIGANQPSSTGLDGGNSEIIKGRCAERQLDVRWRFVLGFVLALFTVALLPAWFSGFALAALGGMILFLAIADLSPRAMRTLQSDEDQSASADMASPPARVETACHVIRAILSLTKTTWPSQ